ncbi:cytochrome P450 3A6 [Tricladium varicosporioides]|nr:cytochrome P450 3A6 [Hymenoscyphus varicosporioides]
MLSLIISIAIALFISWYLPRYLLSVVKSPLSSIPNLHWTSPYTQLYVTYLKGAGKEHRTRLAAHRKLGSVVRVGPNELAVNCIENGVQTIYSGNFEKSDWYAGFISDRHPFMFAMRSNKAHIERKRMLSQVYTKSYVMMSEELSTILNTIVIGKFLPRVARFAEEGKAIDIHRENKALIMDIATAYFFGLGNGTGMIENPVEKKMIDDFDSAIKGIFWFTEFPYLLDWVLRLRVPIVPQEIIEAFPKLEEFCYKICLQTKEKISSGSLKESLPIVYSEFRRKLEASETVRPDELDTEIATEMLDHVQGAQEGTGITITYLMCELARHPESLAKLRQELSQFGQLTELPSAPSIEALPYLDAVLTETMRLYPGSSGPFPRVVPEKGAWLGDFDVPAGTVVASSVYCLHQNAEVFEDPEKWRPERWAEANLEKKKEMRKWFWAFGSGGRICIGNHLAIRMMKTVVVAFFSRFETVLVLETRIEQTDGLIGTPVAGKVFLKVRENT